MSTPTPRTDEAQFGTGRVSVEFARQLERELDEAREEIGSLKAQAIELQIKTCQLTHHKAALVKAGYRFAEVARESVCERSVVIANEALTAINEALEEKK